MRGWRKWDPISPYLFIFCAEILGILFQNNQDKKRINIDGEEYDDTSDSFPKSLDEIPQTLDLYANVSGLKMDFTKTKLIRIGCKKKIKRSLSSL